MGKEYPAGELASRTFVITIVSAALFIAAVFLFVI